MSEAPSATQAPPDQLTPAARENIDRLAEFQERDDAEVSRVQESIEAASEFFGSPAYFVFVVAFIACWIGTNVWGGHAGWAHVDEFPFFALQGIVSANALLLTVAVLIRQNRMSKQAMRRAHLDLHVNLLTEQKVSKVLEVVDGMRKSLGLAATEDAQATELATAADPHAILTAIKDAEAEKEASPTGSRPEGAASPASSP